MFRMIGALLIALAATAAATNVLAQQAPVSKGTAPSGSPAPAAPAIPGAKDVVATVTSHGQTDNITKGEVFALLSNYPAPQPEDREVAYKTAIDMITGNLLIKHFLTAQRIQVPESQVDQQLEQLKQQLKKQGQDLETALRQSGSTMEDMRKEVADQLRLQEFYRSRITDPALRRYLNENHDRFARTQVRASHIMLRVEPSATKEQKEKIKQKLEGIRKEIVSGKITFAAAANKYSEDPANEGGAGGDLDYFTLDMRFVEEFADAAFKMKKGEISEPVETPYGFHLIQVTDRKEGKLPDFEQVKPYLTQSYQSKLQKDIVEDERRSAKIDIKPMPNDFFPAAPPANATAPVGLPGGAAAPKS